MSRQHLKTDKHISVIVILGELAQVPR